jgi:Putative zinc-finger
MKPCRQNKQELVAFILGDLDREDGEAISRHLGDCPACRREMESLKRIFNGAGAAKKDIEKVMATVDWEALPERIARRVFDRPERLRAPSAGRSWFRPFLLRPLAASLLAGLVLGGLAMFLLLRSNLQRPVRDTGFYASPEFLDRVELELARRETLSYLDKSQTLLLDFVQPASADSTQLWREGFGQRQAQALLTQKKYINSQLGRRQMAQAKAICDQIELLILELTQVGRDLTGEERAEIRDRIEASQLWLKINLVKKELQDSEAESL